MEDKRRFREEMIETLVVVSATESTPSCDIERVEVRVVDLEHPMQ
jgi:hypothetical protein